MKKYLNLTMAVVGGILAIVIFLKLYPELGLGFFKEAHIKITHYSEIRNPMSGIEGIYLDKEQIPEERITQTILEDQIQDDLVPILHEVQIDKASDLIGQELVIMIGKGAMVGDLNLSLSTNHNQLLSGLSFQINNYNSLVYQFPSWTDMALSYSCILLLGIFIFMVTYEYLAHPEKNYFKLNKSWVFRICLGLAGIAFWGGLLIQLYADHKIRESFLQWMGVGFSYLRLWAMLIYLMGILTYCYPFLQQRFKEKVPIYLIWINCLIICVGSVLVAELTYNPYIQALSLADILKNSGVILGVILLVYGLTRSYKLGCILSVILSFAFGFANQQLLYLRNEIFLPTNLKMAGVAKQVVGKYTLELDGRDLNAILLVFILIYFSLYLPKTSRVEPFELKKEIKERVLIAILCFSIVFISEGNVKRFLDSRFAFYPESVYMNSGSLQSFISIYECSKLEVPPNYNKKELEAYMEGFDKKEFNQKKPHIILIQSEALANYFGMGNLQLSRDPLAYTHSLKNQMRYGKMFVNVYGGGTVNTEYEVLTGNSLRYFPLGAYPFQQFVSDSQNSMATYLGSLGYKTLGIHPELSSNYRRSLAWERLGIEDRRFIDHETLASENKAENWVRFFMKDAFMYDYIINEFENRKDDSPIFTFLVTMQNHGGYFGEFLSQDNIKIAGTEDKSMLEYLNMVETTDQAFPALINYFSQLNEPVIIGIYGDHQPNIGKQFVEHAGLMDGADPRREDFMWAPYYIWTNFPVESGIESDISANYLGEYVLETAFGIENLPSYWQAIGKQRKEVPIITSWGIFYDGHWYENEADIPDYQEKFRWYDDFIYYSVVDKSEKQGKLWNGQ